MSHSTLDEALDALRGAGTATIDGEGHHAEVDVTDVDRLGVKVREVRVRRDAPVDVVEEAHALPERLRALPERVRPIEVDPTLGGARLRSEPQGKRGAIYEVDVEEEATTIRRTARDADGQRHPEEFTLTREQLDRLLEQAAG